MTVNRGLVFWGVALITAGVVALAIVAGAIDAEAARNLWRFWPVALIVIGLAVIAGRTPLALVATIVAALVLGGLGGTLVGGFPDGVNLGCDGEPEETLTDDGAFGDAAEVYLNLDCGSLDVTTTAGSDWSLTARYAAGEAPDVETDDGSLRVESEGAAVFGFTDARQAWDVVLPTDSTLDLEVDANAASSSLTLDDGSFSNLSVDANAGEVAMNLGGATITNLGIDANAGSIALEVDDETELTGEVSMNAGSLDLCVPDGVGVEISLEDTNVTFSHNLDESSLTRNGDTWSTGGDATVSLNVSGNAASFTLNPEEGC